jgi:hypothetical protein
MLSVIVLHVIMLNIIMMSVVMLNVVMMSVAASKKQVLNIKFSIPLPLTLSLFSLLSQSLSLSLSHTHTHTHTLYLSPFLTLSHSLRVTKCERGDHVSVCIRHEKEIYKVLVR